MWDQDWSVQALSLKKTRPKKKKGDENILKESTPASSDSEFEGLKAKFQHLMDLKDLLPARPPLLPGYPAWYRKLCLRLNDPNWQPGPMALGTGMQVAPKLMSLCWEGYPLHFIRGLGWGFLVPFKAELSSNDRSSIPLTELVKKCPVMDVNSNAATTTESEQAFRKLSTDVEKHLSKRDYYSKKAKDPTDGVYQGTGVWCDTELEGCCWFFKLPHKDGVAHRVGNPLAKDFLIKFSENVLAGDSVTAERVIQIARMLSYWRNNRDRISGQIVVACGDDDAKDRLDTAAILPMVVTCGTLTRRASESTWMTASNAISDRIGSELRAMVQAPEGYRIVGADVDSQELWIASVLGDASATGIHGATPLGWMTLNGTKSSGTDMHSVTARAVGISRDHAKVLNYARIYGAGQTFATRLLKQFNPTISDGEAKSKATKMFALTKGRKMYYLRDDFDGTLEDRAYHHFEVLKLAAVFRRPVNEIFRPAKWYGGIESAMFNRLEEIAEMEQPVTPFLQVTLR